MKINNYVIAKTKSNGEITFISYKTEGFKLIPKGNINYPGIEVNSIVLIKPSFINKVLKRKNKIKLNYYLNYLIEEADDDSSDIKEVLDDIERYKGVIEFKYRKYLDDKYINLLNKKLDLLEKKLKSKIIYKSLKIDEKQEKKGKSR